MNKVLAGAMKSSRHRAVTTPLLGFLNVFFLALFESLVFTFPLCSVRSDGTQTVLCIVQITGEIGIGDSPGRCVAFEAWVSLAGGIL